MSWGHELLEDWPDLCCLRAEKCVLSSMYWVGIALLLGLKWEIGADAKHYTARGDAVLRILEARGRCNVWNMMLLRRAW